MPAFPSVYRTMLPSKRCSQNIEHGLSVLLSLPTSLFSCKNSRLMSSIGGMLVNSPASETYIQLSLFGTATPAIGTGCSSRGKRVPPDLTVIDCSTAKKKIKHGLTCLQTVYEYISFNIIQLPPDGQNPPPAVDSTVSPYSGVAALLINP